MLLNVGRDIANIKSGLQTFSKGQTVIYPTSKGIYYSLKEIKLNFNIVDSTTYLPTPEQTLLIVNKLIVVVFNENAPTGYYV